MVQLCPKRLCEYLSRVFVAAGANESEALAIAENLVDANLAGHDSHGVVRVPRYLRDERRKHVKFGQSVEMVIDGGAFTLLEGRFGFGQVLGRQSVEIGISKASEHGVALVALRNAGHLGRIGEWAEQAADAGYISIHFVNVARSMLVAPFGAAERRMSTAPVTIGIANGTDDHFILDFATSRIAEGKALIALQGGPKPPFGGLVDSKGLPTDDPQVLYGPVAEGEVPNPRAGPGALVAMGDHKGSGLAIACELLAGALTGSGTTGPGEGPYNGMFSIYIDPAVIDDGHGAAASISNYIDFVRQARPADGVDSVMVPGDPERRARHLRQHRLPLPSDTWQRLIEAGDYYGVQAPASVTGP
ncbi:hypothetical protein AB833_19815 [Chromatiales bacterium (ex Bugula neritina AB1)]|nr:hypothetical protein AB833_19815 [Chromatiales bacterium (ex Bugula neritina AB1)]